MRKLTRAIFTAANLISFSAASTSAFAADPLDFYAGAAVGRANVRDDDTVLDNPLRFSESGTGWKLQVGMRPISLAGIELEYIHFGHPGTGFSALQADVEAKAAALLGVLYAPLPIPHFDLYAKAGVARLQTTVNAALNAEGFSSSSPFNFHGEQTEQRVAYGAGAQLKFSALAIRLEYERINDGSGNPDLLSLGLAWSF